MVRVLSFSAEGGGTGRGAKRQGRAEVETRGRSGLADRRTDGRTDELDQGEGGDKTRAEGVCRACA